MKRGRRALPASLGVPALCIVTMAGCGAAEAPVVPPAHATLAPGVQPADPITASPPPPTAQAASCPRLPRAHRTWTGFAIDVPSEAMHLALDALVPIQEALGALFCGPERAPCRPLALRSVELADASALAARVEFDTATGAPPSVLQLRELNGTWRAEPESLAAFLASCRAAAR